MVHEVRTPILVSAAHQRRRAPDGRRGLLDIFASHGLHISKADHLTARGQGRRGHVKRIVTEPTLTIEAKGFDAGEAINRLSIMMASNEDWVCPASNDERRFAVFNVSDARKKDRAYFARLIEEIKSGETEAFFADMLAMELGDWHPRNDVPETEGLAMQKQESAGPETQWLWNILEEGMLPEALQSYTDHRLVGEAPDMARSQALFQNCKQSDQRLRYGFHIAKFGRFLSTYGVAKVRRSSGNFFLFPPLAEIRAKFLELNPWAEAFTPGHDEWVGPAKFP